MSMFSQSFFLNEDVLRSIENDVKQAKTKTKEKLKNNSLNDGNKSSEMEVIFESPTSKISQLSSYESIKERRDRNKSTKSFKRKSLKRNKSDSMLQHKNENFNTKFKSQDNISDFFKSDINFNDCTKQKESSDKLSFLFDTEFSIKKLNNSNNIELNSKIEKQDIINNTAMIVDSEDLFATQNNTFNININLSGNLQEKDKSLLKYLKDSSSFSMSLSSEQQSECNELNEAKTIFDESLGNISSQNISITALKQSLENALNVSVQNNEQIVDKSIWEDSQIFNEFFDVENNFKTKFDEKSCKIDDNYLQSDNVTFIQPSHEVKKENNLNAPNECNFGNLLIENEMKKNKRKIKKILDEIDIETENDNISMLVESFSASISSKRINNLSQKILSQNNNSTISISQSLKKLKKKSNLLCHWGLPSAILNEYKNKGITEMFNWQSECLSNKKILFESTNLVYCAPTSAGKTLVSEILMIKNVLERKKKALFILPFVSVVREKMYYLQDLLTSSGLRVEGFFGGYNPPGGFEHINVAVCTIEKANSIINRLLEQNRLSDIGILVIDEVHLISDPSRGYILELLLAKVLYLKKTLNIQIQIVTMSATLPNLELLTNWLGAEFYFTDFRPVELIEMIKIGNTIYNNQMNIIRNLNLEEYNNLPKDQDNIGTLCIETMLEHCSIIVFCPSKDWCEQLGLHIANFIYNVGKSKSDLGLKLRNELNLKLFDEVKLQLRNCPTGLDSVLEKTISYGCAFHHAGLTSDERDIIESSFKNGSLRVIVATSTLSSGVNLPARRVIIRTPLFAGKQMNSLTYKQMIGRAGRKGKDTLGESILICNDGNKNMGKDLICAKLNPITSCLSLDNYINLKRALLEIIASGVANTKEDLEIFMNCTLLCSERSYKAYYQDKEDPIEHCINFLTEYEFIRLQVNEATNTDNYVPTKLGLACFSSSVPPGDGFLLFTELQKARQCFVLESELHAVYLVTPYSVCYQLQEIDWLYYLDLWERLPASMKRVGELVGVRDAFLVKAMRGNGKLDYKTLQIHKRFYTALALQELVNETPICKVADKFKCPRGLLQSLQQMSSTFAGIVTSFCNSLNWTLLSLIVSQFKERLFFGIHQELLDLMKLPLLNGARARALFDNDIKTLVDLANSNTFDVEKILYSCSAFDLEKKRENENEYEANERINLRNLYITGKANISIKEASKIIIEDARKYVEQEMGIKNIDWCTKTDNTVPEEIHTTSLSIDPDAPLINSQFSEPDTQETSLKRKLKDSEVTSLKRTRIKQKSVKEELTENIVDMEQLKEINMFSNDSLLAFDKSDDDSSITSSQNLYKTQYNKNNNSLENNNKVNNSMSSNSDEFSLKNLLLNGSHIINDNKYGTTQSLDLSHIQIIDVCKSRKLFDLFKCEMNKKKNCALAVGIEMLPNIEQKPIIGKELFSKNIHKTVTQTDRNCLFNENYFITGISICFNKNIVCFINLQIDSDDLINLNERIIYINYLFLNLFTIKICDAKEQLKIFKKCLPNFQIDKRVIIEDPKIINWLLQPDVLPSINNMTLKFLPEGLSLIKLAGKCSAFTTFGLNYNSDVSGRIRSVIEACVTFHIANEQLLHLEKKENKEILQAYKNIEMPIQLSLYKMEVHGFPIDENLLASLLNQLFNLMKITEEKIYQLNGHRFNLSSTVAVAKALGISKRGKKVSTSKQILENMDLPITKLILDYRKLNTVLKNIIQPISHAIVDNRIYSNSITFTTTGRISMHEPNLQNIAKNFNITLNDNDVHTISCRNIFKTNETKCLLSVDFCQLELRILTHLSKDRRLLNVMNSKEDVFKSIAAKWNNIDKKLVTDEMRTNTKHICYGIIYGMGIKSLAIVLKKDIDYTTNLIEQFHNTFPSIRKCTQNIVDNARENGYVETLFGRKRYLPNINSTSSSIKAQAERQAVNTTIQGTAADIAKKGIIQVEKCLTDNDINLILHIHDELIYEVPLNKLKQVIKIVKYNMENCIKLNIPLYVKLKTGNCWGEMTEINTII